MRKLLFTLSMILLLSSCGDKVPENLTVTGNIKGLKKGMLYLQSVPDSTLITIDSLAVNGDGNFSFNTHLESPEVMYLYLDKKDNNNYNDRITFFAEPGTVTINTDWNTFDTTAKITGSKSNEKLEEYRKTMSSINKRNMKNLLNATQSEKPLDQKLIDSLENVENRNIQRGYAFSINFALNNNDSYIAPYIAAREIPNANIKYLDSIFGILPPEIANSKYGQELKALIE